MPTSCCARTPSPPVARCGRSPRTWSTGGSTSRAEGGSDLVTNEPREHALAKAFVALADTLVADYDVVDLLQNLVDTSVSLLDSAAGGLLLADDLGVLTLVASTSEETSLVELLQ